MDKEIDIEHHLLIISERETEKIEARRSLEVLYCEFRDFVYNVSWKNLHSPLHKEELATSILNKVFMYIHENPLKWSYSSSTHKSQKDAFKAFLSRIANNYLHEELRNLHCKWEKEELVIDDAEDLFKEDFSENELENLEESLSQNHQVIEQVLAELRPRDKEIIRTYFLYYEEGKKFPREVLSELVSIHETTPDNIRKIVSRTKKKIKKLGEPRIQKVAR